MRRNFPFALLLFPASLIAQSADEKKATIQFLTALQQPDGGFILAPGRQARGRAAPVLTPSDFRRRAGDPLPGR